MHPGKSQWSKCGIDEEAVRPYSLTLLRELERHIPGADSKEKHEKMEDILHLGTGSRG